MIKGLRISRMNSQHSILILRIQKTLWNAYYI
ncbi:hypothetical protein T01_2957 [Trichinella spiralis]|uniref:Uncharacterized protein n=1 Tax=Trichinella spiralis TaxID=6334 RepID=A0A0V0ZC82_TRISP|nr:hypothetical protein T01_2957 [Trichinella spiralis]